MSMTFINFINTLSAKQHHQLHRWWKISCVIFCAVLASIVVLQGMQLYGLYKAMSEHRSVQKQARVAHDELAPYTALKKEEESLRAQRTKIDQIYHTAERSRALLASLYATNQFVQSCKLDKAHFELIMQCVNTEAALNEVTRLRAVKQFQEVKLFSLQQSKKDASMIATIKGKIRK